MNMGGDLTSRNMNNGEESNKDNPRFRNLKVNNRDNLRFNNQDNNLGREFSNRKDKSKDPRFDNRRENQRFSNRNTLSLKENVKEGR
jgi:hypothetical protein